MKNENNWICCKYCGHKLGKLMTVSGNGAVMELEIKCHSCKEINKITIKKTV